ncbi:BnaC02g08970D [Brassica napus]|uniref:BnaC02g08970D protein n=1 Tax=Brassica napus TaxID=3708 RepID=A0A078HX13_BRANA|nr:BnaC02g08970D [Brassica napus]
MGWMPLLLGFGSQKRLTVEFTFGCNCLSRLDI